MAFAYYTLSVIEEFKTLNQKGFSGNSLARRLGNIFLDCDLSRVPKTILTPEPGVKPTLPSTSAVQWKCSFSIGFIVAPILQCWLLMSDFFLSQIPVDWLILQIFMTACILFQYLGKCQSFNVLIHISIMEKVSRPTTYQVTQYHSHQPPLFWR